MRCMNPNETLPEDNESTIPSSKEMDASVEQELQSEARPRHRRRSLILILSLLLIFSIGLGALGGYLIGTSQGQEMKSDTISATTDEQYRLALEDLEAGRFELARQRLEYVIRLNPTYPGVADKLAEALLRLNAPTVTPIILATPTPNLAPVEELFGQAQTAFEQEDWSLALETLLTLRAKDAAYRAIDVDRLMFSCLRNRGVHRISVEGSLEEGIYDLTRAELFGPLDRDADNWRSWAELYLLANSYMGVDWEKASYYFAQVYLIAPYLKNDAYIKYATSARAYADQLITEKDPCAAQEQYSQSLLAWENPELAPTATNAANACLTATASAPPPPPPEESTTPTETPLGGETPTPTATPAPTSGSGSEGG
jgi:tetratricopeptide (TPR) repeat protein